MITIFSKKSFCLLLIFSKINSNEINKKEIVNYKIPKEINLEFIKDDKVFLKDSLNTYVYKMFYIINFLPVIVSGGGLCFFEKNTNDYLKTNYMLPFILISQLIFNIFAPIKLNFFKFKITWFIINNFLNLFHLFFILNNNLNNKNIYVTNLVIYLILSNITIGICSLDKKLKIHVNELIKELDKDSESPDNFFI